MMPPDKVHTVHGGIGVLTVDDGEGCMCTTRPDAVFGESTDGFK